MSLQGFDHRVAAFLQASHWYVAYSGGLDSHVLLVELRAYLLAYKQDNPNAHCPSLIAIHINHQLQTEASVWARHSVDVCSSLSLEVIVKAVDVCSDANVEAEARAKRYEVFESIVGEGDVLFVGHHQNDQLETFLYRLFRGAGVHGLSAIPEQRPLAGGVLCRPLLEYSRGQLLDYARRSDLVWVEDPTNQHSDFDRNYIRLQILPAILKRWPSFAASVSRLIGHLRESSILMAEVAAEDLLACRQGEDGRYHECWLNCDDVVRLSQSRQKNLLRFYLKGQGLVLSNEQFNQLLEQIIRGRKDGAVLYVAGINLRYFRQRLYVCCDEERSVLSSEEVSWSGMDTCQLPSSGALSLAMPLDISLTVKFRQGGERCILPGAKHSTKLKHVLQELNVPPWRRQSLPLIYFGDVLIAVADLIHFDAAEQVLKGSRVLFKP